MIENSLYRLLTAPENNTPGRNGMNFITNSDNRGRVPHRQNHADGDVVTAQDSYLSKKIAQEKAKRLAAQGRGGDTDLALIGKKTAKAMDKVIHGGKKRVNPKTGLREYMYQECSICSGEHHEKDCPEKKQNNNKLDKLYIKGDGFHQPERQNLSSTCTGHGLDNYFNIADDPFSKDIATRINQNLNNKGLKRRAKKPAKGDEEKLAYSALEAVLNDDKELQGYFFDQMKGRGVHMNDVLHYGGYNPSTAYKDKNTEDVELKDEVERRAQDKWLLQHKRKDNETITQKKMKMDPFRERKRQSLAGLKQLQDAETAPRKKNLLKKQIEIENNSQIYNLSEASKNKKPVFGGYHPAGQQNEHAVVLFDYTPPHHKKDKEGNEKTRTYATYRQADPQSDNGGTPGIFKRALTSKGNVYDSDLYKTYKSRKADIKGLHEDISENHFKDFQKNVKNNPQFSPNYDYWEELEEKKAAFKKNMLGKPDLLHNVSRIVSTTSIDPENNNKKTEKTQGVKKEKKK